MHKMKALFGLRTVSAKAIALVVALIILSIAGSTAFVLDHFSKVLGTDRLQQNLLAAEMILNPKHEVYSAEDGTLRLGDHVLNGDNASVDAIVSAFGGVATIFQGDKRIATNAKKSDGTRLVGTTLAQGPVYDTVLKSGQRYLGTTTVFNKQYVAAYQPLRDRKGNTVGILFVGFEKGEFNKTFTNAIVIATVTGLILALVCAGIGGFAFHKLFAPFGPLSRLMEEAKNGRYTQNVPYIGRKDEFGGLARVIQMFNKAMKEQEALREAGEKAKLLAAAEQTRAEEEAKARGEALVVGTFGEGLKALAANRLSFRLNAALPPAYRALQENFNTAIAQFEQNLREREEAAKQHEADRIAAAQAQKRAQEEAHRQAVDVVVTSFGEGLAALARRDLTYRLKHNLPTEYRILQDDLNNAISQLEDAMKEIDNRASDIATSSAEINRASQEMAQRTERQAAALEQTAAALNEITQTVGKSAEDAKEASNTAGSAKTDAERGTVVAKNAIDAMRAIEKSSREISQIIGVIDEIAFQTNLLALNAGIEAAGAGDAGRGFAVVASEVRALAHRSAGAAKQIKSLIKTSEEQVDGGVKLVEESGNALTKIAEDIATINNLMAEIATSQREQATSLGEIDSAVTQMDQTTQANAAMAEQSCAASETMAGYAGELADLVGRFETQKTGSKTGADKSLAA